ncbi:hypothetical protein D3C77_782440 [compost metagenome]
MRGASDEEAGNNASRSISMMSERIVYPNAPTPTKVPNDQIVSVLSSLLINVEKKEETW